MTDAAILEQLVESNKSIARSLDAIAAGSQMIPKDRVREIAERSVPDSEVAEHRHRKAEDEILIIQRDRVQALTVEDVYAGKTAWVGQDVDELMRNEVWRRCWALVTRFRPLLPARRVNRYGDNPAGRGPSIVVGYEDKEADLIDVVKVWVADYPRTTQRLCVDLVCSTGVTFRYDSGEPCSPQWARTETQTLATDGRPMARQSASERRIVRQLGTGLRYEVLSQVAGCDLNPGLTGKAVLASSRWLGVVQGKDGVSYEPKPDAGGVVRYSLDDKELQPDGPWKVTSALYPEQDARAVYHMLLGNDRQVDVTTPIPARKRGGDPYTGH